MKIEPRQINQLIRNRRAVFPPMYQPGKQIPKEIIIQILENANWAPTHKLTEPWRFKVFTGKSLERLSKFLGDHYKDNTPEEKFSEIKYKKTLANPLRSACVIAICMQRDPAESLPEWEEIASVACAVQNMWLTATAYGIGAYWSTPAAINSASKLFKLEEGQKCLGLFYMGYPLENQLQGRRRPVSEKIEWME